MKRNYYLVLGVSSNASSEEIKSAFRRLAMELHPDRSGMESEPFRSVQEAYTILSDPDERRRYDQQIGGVKQQRPTAEPLVPGQSAAASGRGAEPFREVSLFGSFEEYHPSFEELFERLWRNFAPASPPKSERAESLKVEIPLSRSQAQRGGSVRILVPVVARCSACGGHGHVGGWECWRCGGQGSLQTASPLTVEFPASNLDSLVCVPLTSLGVENFYLMVHFRVR
jgi:molecular chaperone DnaJ